MVNARRIAVIAVILFLIPVGIATADRVVEDDFEDGLGDWTSVTNFEITTNDPIQGSQAAISTGGSQQVEAIYHLEQSSPSELQLWIRTESAGSDTTVISLRDASDTNLCRIDPVVGDFHLNSCGGGQITTDYDAGKWYRLVLRTDEGAELYDSAGTLVGSSTGQLPSNVDDIRVAQPSNDNTEVSIDYIVTDGTAELNGIKGTVTNQSGSGIENADVTLRTEDEPGIIVTTTTTDENGAFRVNDSELTTNAYTIFVNKWPAYYTNRTVVEHTTNTVTDTGDIVLESRGPRITLADPRANEYVRDRSVNGFNYSYTIQQPISEDNNDDFTTIVYWKNDTTGNFENIHSESNTVKAGSYTVDFQNPDAGNPGVNQWFVSVELRRGTFNSTTYQYNTPGNITLVDASTDATITDATIEATITGVNSDFQTTLSTSDGKLDLNDIPREDHKVTFTTTSGTTYLDRSLIIDETDITKLWTVALVNETEFNDEPEWYQQSFELDDQTGQWDPADTYLFLEQRVSGTYQIITGGQFGFQNNVTLAVNDTESYRMTLLHAERGDTRQVGDFTADRDNAGQIQTITIDSTSPPVEDDSEGYTVNATITNTTGSEPIFRFQFNDSESETFDISFTVHEKGNESNVLQNMTNISFDSAGSITFTIPVTQEEASETWHVDWSATRDGTDISGTLTVGGATLDPGVDMPDQWKHWGATIFIILIGGLFGGSVNARLGVIVTPMIAGVFWVAEWLPTNYTIGIIIFALILGGMLLVANHRLGD